MAKIQRGYITKNMYMNNIIINMQYIVYYDLLKNKKIYETIRVI